MNLQQLKNVFLAKNNINAVNQIIDIENLHVKTHLSINKIIKYLLSICTSKTNKKILNILSNYYPETSLSQNDMNIILNNNINVNSDINSNIYNINTNIQQIIQNNQETQNKINIIQYKNIKKKKSSVKHKIE